MGKSTRIVLLSVTAVLAIAVFLVLWAVRPGSDSALLEQARSRQPQGLVDVTGEVDYDVIADELMADEDFMNMVASAVDVDQEAAVDDETVRRVADEAIQAYVDANIDELYAIVDGRIQAYVDENMDVLDSMIDTAIQDYVDANYDTLMSLIAQQVALESVDEAALADALVEPVSQEILADVQAYVDTIDVEAIVAGIEEQVETYVQSVFAQANAYTDEQVASIRDAVMDSDEVRSLVDGLEKRILDEVDSRIEDSAMRRVVSIPDFEASPVVTSEDDYSSVREAERQGAIQSLLNALSN